MTDISLDFTAYAERQKPKYSLTTPKAKLIIEAVDTLHKAGEYPGAIRVSRYLGKVGKCTGMSGRDNYVRKHRMRELGIKLAEDAFADLYDVNDNYYSYGW